MFVAATLYSDSGSCAVNIRNMSLQGALIEGAVLPQQNAAVRLRRGSLEAVAKIVWQAGRKAGVAFCATVHIADWISRNPDCHQARVDEIVRGIRTGSDHPAAGALAPGLHANPSVAAELTALKAELMTLESGLTGDVIMVATHPEIQLIDVALQRVERILKGINAAG